MGHEVPSPTTVLVGEVLPAGEPHAEQVTSSWISNRRAFIEECGRAYREVGDELGVDPNPRSDSNLVLMRVVLDPWSNAAHIPKKYKELPPELPATPAEPENKKQGLVLQTRRS